MHIFTHGSFFFCAQRCIICDRSVIAGVFAGGLDGHQHFPLRLVLPLLRLGGSVFLHAPSLGGESCVTQGVSSAQVAIITIIITIIIIIIAPSSPPWLGPELLLLFSTLTAC